MKTIVKEILPRVEMQQLKTDNTKSRDKARFYAELDWDSFYMKFPIMQELKGEYMNLKKAFWRRI